MDKNDFKATAEKYKQEMLALYGGKKEQPQQALSDNTADTNTDNPQQSDTLTPSDTTPEQNDTPQEQSQADTDSADGKATPETSDDIDELFPPPIIPDFIKNNQSPDADDKRDAYGYLKVSVRTGRGGIPIGGNSVIVSETVNGEENLVRMLTTDQSGDTETLRLPTMKNPDGTEPSDYTAASLYNISVISEGYFKEVSQNVAVFDGITSVQTFFLIPEPFDYTTDETVIFDNPEPEI